MRQVVRRYMEKIEEHSRGNAHQEHVYLTPDQAMEILRTEVSGGHVNSAQSSGVAAAEDIETAPSTIHADRRSAHHKTHFTYQEAENAHDFFVPYIWTTIVSVHVSCALICVADCGVG